MNYYFTNKSREKRIIEMLELSDKLKLADTDLLVSNEQISDETGWHDVFIFREDSGNFYECKIDRYGGATYHVPNKVKQSDLLHDFESALYDQHAEKLDNARIWPPADNE